MVLAGVELDRGLVIAAVIVAAVFVAALALHFGQGGSAETVRVGTLRGGVSTLDVITKLRLD